jgi:transposase
MINLPAGIKIYLAIAPINMHRSFDGLSMLAQEVVQQNPLKGHLFVFRNKRADKIKLFIWDRNGFFIFYKRVERGRFKFPKVNQDSIEISREELTLLLDGIDVSRLKRFPTLHYSVVA